VVRVSDEVRRLRKRFEARAEESHIWDAVQLARNPDRPYTLDYAERLFTDAFELRGDRAFSDDEALITMLARYHGQTVVAIGHQKGRDLSERTRRMFGMPHPEGYRKAIRAVELADRFGYPILTFVDTPGAYPGVNAEERGQAGMIARSILAFCQASVPIVSTVIGEGGSGGALAIAVGDRVLMQQNSIYSVISPEGCAAILWKDSGQARKAAYAFRPTANACLDLGVIDRIVEEPKGGAHEDVDAAAKFLDDAIRQSLQQAEMIPAAERRQARRAKFRQMGVWGVVDEPTNQDF
jgi:acetyl-CoA carboxylase carboxyl transferase subunit alpha